jgi:hypothetical protein
MKVTAVIIFILVVGLLPLKAQDSTKAKYRFGIGLMYHTGLKNVVHLDGIYKDMNNTYPQLFRNYHPSYFLSLSFVREKKSLEEICLFGTSRTPTQYSFGGSIKYQIPIKKNTYIGLSSLSAFSEQINLIVNLNRQTYAFRSIDVNYCSFGPNTSYIIKLKKTQFKITGEMFPVFTGHRKVYRMDPNNRELFYTFKNNNFSLFKNYSIYLHVQF